MSTTIRMGLGIGLALYVIAGGPSPSQPASPPKNLGAEPASDGQSAGPAADWIGGPTSRTTIRIIAPDDGNQLGTILFGIADNGLEPIQNWGGPR